MPIIFRNQYGKKQLSDGTGYEEITPTKQKFVEADGSDVRLDRVRVFDPLGKLVASFLRDPMGCRFTDNLPRTEDDMSYLASLPQRKK